VLFDNLLKSGLWRYDKEVRISLLGFFLGFVCFRGDILCGAELIVQFLLQDLWEWKGG